MKKTKFSKYLKRVTAILLFISLVIAPLPLYAQSNTTDSLEVGKTYHGFKLTRQEKVDEINSTAEIFEHSKTGAKLIYLRNDDDNKVFTINFRTPPENSTGVAHIIEHSVLCGSRNFPTKDPFLAMMKKSLNTYLNAATYADKTAYPVASRNHKDFRNLINVYLDAVFYPNFYENDKIFKQEGWRHELETVDGELNYNGIVYNEMKGNYSNAQRLLGSKIDESLFPDSIYRHDSGGNPENIPDLTYEEFVNFHKKYYHPSNSYIYLYGDMDIMETLKFINDNYLANFDKKEIDSEIPMQEPFDQMKEVYAKYSVPEGTDTSNKTYMALNYAMPKQPNVESYLSAFISFALFDYDSSPVKKAILDAGLGSSSTSSYSSGKQQPTFSIMLNNTNKDKAEAFKKVVFDTLTKLVNEGMDKDRLKEEIASIEYSSRQQKSNATRGMNYNDSIMMGWLYGGDPLAFLKVNDVLEDIKGKIDDNYIENFIKENILENTHSSLVVLEPQPGLASKNNAKLSKKLQDYKNSLTDEEKKQLVKQTAELKKWQETEDTEEALATIPTLSLSDINDDVKEIPTDIEKINDITILNHPIYTNDIGYIEMYFDTTKVPQEQIPYLYLLSSLLKKVDTEKYSYEDLVSEVKSNTGGIGFGVQAYSKYGDSNTYYPKMVVGTNVLSSKLPKAFALTSEIINNSKFDDVDRLKEIISNYKSQIESGFSSNGAGIAINRTFSYFSEVDKYGRLGSGLDYYNFICEVEKQLENAPNTVIDNLNKVYKLAFDKENLIVGVTIDKKNYDKFKKEFNSFSKDLKVVDGPRQTYNIEFDNIKEGIKVPSKVQYVVQGYNYEELGYEYSGKMEVLSKVLNTDYLWPQLRVKGGAYGGYSIMSEDGTLGFYSYRDPRLKGTLESYDGMVKFLETFNASKEDMVDYIIGTIGSMDRPLSPWQKGSNANANYIKQITYEDIKQIRKEILNTTGEDIKTFAKMIKSIMEKDNYSVVGNGEKIEQHKDVFDIIIDALSK
ncbi:insulinase family protein [Dethiothermospora halolimnae]|uniref:insulinase family protein n=1 Tax=Dethiothermospora halolimnae TaxID=3114390 RepID=UPI003CCC05C1